MIAQVDEALCLLLRSCLPAGTQIRLDPPKPAWQTESGARGVDVFLFALQNAGPVGEGGGGRGAGTRAGATRCRLSYLVTARGAGVGDEHALLDAALRAVVSASRSPEKWLSASARVALAESGPDGLWASLGMPARAGFVVAVEVGVGEPRKAVREAV